MLLLPLASALAAPVLHASNPLYATRPDSLWVDGVAPNTRVLFLGSYGAAGVGPCAPGGPCTSLVAPVILGHAVADASGIARLPVTWPADPRQPAVSFQAVAGKGGQRQLSAVVESTFHVDCSGAVGLDYLDACGVCLDRDAAPAELLYAEGSGRPLGATCVDVPLPGPVTPEEVHFATRGATVGWSDTWLYLVGPDGQVTRGYELVDYGPDTYDLYDVVIDPAPVSSYRMCSWWNAAYVSAVELSGDPGACVPDCAGVWGGASTTDHCGVCDDDPANDCVMDCAGVWGGTATDDGCGRCDADPANDCVPDCLGVPSGTAYVDPCGTCIDRSAARPELLWSEPRDRAMMASCADFPVPTPRMIEGARAVVAGQIPGGLADAWVYLLDESGAVVVASETVADGFTPVAARLELAEPAVVSAYRVCSWWNPAWLRSLVLVGDGSTCVQDCADVWGGPSTVDACGTCDADPGNDCP